MLAESACSPSLMKILHPAGILHVIGPTAYGLVVLRVAAWLPRESRLAMMIIVTGIIGLAGNVAYGFDTIHSEILGGASLLVDIVKRYAHTVLRYELIE